MVLMLAFALAVLGGCASSGKTITPQTEKPNVNLAGFPPAFKEGYSDGCASARALVGSKKDEARFKSDPQYAQGWRDGHDICKVR
jgi:uncharacterized protein YceK